MQTGHLYCARVLSYRRAFLCCPEGCRNSLTHSLARGHLPNMATHAPTHGAKAARARVDAADAWGARVKEKLEGREEVPRSSPRLSPRSSPRYRRDHRRDHRRDNRRDNRRDRTCSRPAVGIGGNFHGIFTPIPFVKQVEALRSLLDDDFIRNQ